MAFAEADFLFSATDGLDMTNVEQSQRDYVLYMIRLAPDSPACRQAIRKLSEQNPEQVLNIALLNELGNIVPAAMLVVAVTDRSEAPSAPCACAFSALQPNINAKAYAHFTFVATMLDSCLYSPFTRYCYWLCKAIACG